MFIMKKTLFRFSYKISKALKKRKTFFFHYYENFSLLCTAAEFKVNKNNGLIKNNKKKTA